MSNYRVDHVFTNGRGEWRAFVVFNRARSSDDKRSTHNTNEAIKRARRLARPAIIDAIMEREQKAGESRWAAWGRINASLPNLKVINVRSYSHNALDYGVTLGE